MTSAIGANRPSESATDKGMSVAKLGLIGTIVAATVPALATVVVAVGFGEDASKSPTAGVGGTVVQTSPFGSVGKVTPNNSGSEVAVAGWAATGVDDVVVLIGPKSSQEKFWVANASVVDQRWDVVVKTDPHVESGYSVTAYFNRGVTPPPGAQAKPLDLTTTPTTPSTMPADVTQCAALYGDRCFTDPSWGPPAVYKPNA
jgi:hypothetical protein